MNQTRINFETYVTICDLSSVEAAFDKLESGQCPRGSYIVLEYVRISDTRTLLRCIRCLGIVGMLDDIPASSTRSIVAAEERKFEKVQPPKREWSLAEMAKLR